MKKRVISKKELIIIASVVLLIVLVFLGLKITGYIIIEDSDLVQIARLVETNETTGLIDVILSIVSSENVLAIQENFSEGCSVIDYYTEPRIEIFEFKESESTWILANHSETLNINLYYTLGIIKEGNNWCNGADIDKKGEVGAADLALLLNNWDRTNCSGQEVISSDECNNISGKWIIVSGEPPVSGNNWCDGADINRDGVVNPGDDDVLTFWYGRTDCSEISCSQGLIGYWKFDEGFGTTAFDFLESNNGLLINNPNWVSGKINNALSFDGVDDYVDLGNMSSFGSQIKSSTVSVWVKTTDTTAEETAIIKIIDDSSPPYSNDAVYSIELNRKLTTNCLLQYNSSYTLFYIRDNTNNVLAKHITTNIYDNNWHHIVWRIIDSSSNSMEVYIDGVNQSLIGSCSNLPSNFNDWSDTLVIGAGNNRGTISAFFNGTIDEIAIFNRALSDSEISEYYNNGEGKPLCIESTENNWCNNADINQDGIVNNIDENLMMAEFGRTDCLETASVTSASSLTTTTTSSSSSDSSGGGTSGGTSATTELIVSNEITSVESRQELESFVEKAVRKISAQESPGEIRKSSTILFFVLITVALGIIVFLIVSFLRKPKQ